MDNLIDTLIYLSDSRLFQNFLVQHDVASRHGINNEINDLKIEVI